MKRLWGLSACLTDLLILTAIETVPVLTVALVQQSAEETPPEEDADAECQEALEQARAAAKTVVSYSRRPISCIERRNLMTDCSSELRELENVQEEYESAIAKMRVSCD